MDNKSKSIQVNNNIPDWATRLMPIASALFGAAVLWATWYFYSDFYKASNFHWYNWIQPVLMVIMGFTSITAAVLFAVGSPAGWTWLQLSICIVPIIFMIRLIIVALRFMVHIVHWIPANIDLIASGNIFTKITIGPKLIINLILVSALILFSLVRKAGKAKNT